MSQQDLDKLLHLFELAKLHTQESEQSLNPVPIVREVIPLGGKPRMEELKGRPDEELVVRFSPKEGAQTVVKRLLSEKAASGVVYDPKSPLGQLDKFFYELASRVQKPPPIPYHY